MGIVVIGGGQAAGNLIDELSSGGYTGALTLVSDERHLPYQRPPLCKRFLAGELDVERLAIRPRAFYEQHDVALLLGRRAVAIDRSERRLVLDDGERLDYSALALTTGCRVRTLEVPGATLAGIFHLRRIDDVLRIRERLAAAQRVAIIGAGLIGLEAAAILRRLGREVIVVEAQARVMARVVGTRVSDFYRRLHQSHGVVIHTNSTIAGFDGGRSVEAVRLDDGRAIPAQLVLVAVGVVPNVELAQAAGLACDDGIHVDEFARTRDPHIVAAGDVASHPNPFYGRRIRLESVHNAGEQARVAAATLLGRAEPYAQYPWFWSDQYDRKLQIVGLAEGHDRVVTRGDADAGSFSVFYYRGDRLLAVESVARPADHLQARRILGSGVALSPQQAADPRVDLRAVA